jgi:hypothetical protein
MISPSSNSGLSRGSPQKHALTVCACLFQRLTYCPATGRTPTSTPASRGASHTCGRTSRKVNSRRREQVEDPLIVWTTDGGKAVSLKGRQRSTPYKHAIICWYPFLLEAEQAPGPKVAGRIRKLGNISVA